MRTMLRAALAACALLLSAAAPAQDDAAAQKAFDDARRVAKDGPVDIPLAGQGLLKLPAGRTFIPQPQAMKVLNAMGNPGDDARLQGIVFPLEGGGWFATVRYFDSGHIADDEAKDWNADELLKNIREGTEASNAERVKIGGVAIEVQGWAERPAYDAAMHRLVWAISSRGKDAAADEPQGVNYNTFMLGREGYFTLNLVTDMNLLATHKPAAQGLLAALNFDEGKRYADFNASTDRTAEYGIAALVAGVAAKKLGLLALAGVFFAKFFKVILLGLAVVGGGALKIFGRRKSAPPAP